MGNCEVVCNTVHVVLTDITCDTDVKVDTFIGNDDDGKYELAMHSFEERREPYDPW